MYSPSPGFGKDTINKEKKEKKEKEQAAPTKSKAQLQKEARDAEKATAAAESAASSKSRRSVEQEKAQAAPTKPKAQLQKEARDAEKAKAVAETEALPKPKPKREPPKDTRPKAAKEREGRNELKEQLGGAYVPETQTQAQLEREALEEEQTRAENERIATITRLELNQARAEKAQANKARAENDAAVTKKAAQDGSKRSPPQDDDSSAEEDAESSDDAETRASAKDEKANKHKAEKASTEKDVEAQRTKQKKELKTQMGQSASNAMEFVNSKTKSATGQKNSAVQEGLDIFEELSSEEPGEVADWFMTQVRKAGKTDNGVESLPLYKFACAVNSATDEQRQQIVTAAISGYGAMQPQDRAEVLALVVQNASAAQAKPSKAGDSQIVSNMRTIVKAAKLEKMPEEERDSLLLVTQSQAMELATPQHFTEALTHMSPEDRKELSSALVKTKFIPKEQAALIEEIVQPDGILDEMNANAGAVSMVRDCVWVIAALPVLEWMCARRWANTTDCTSSLVSWLHIDSCLSLTMVCFVLIAYKLLAPAYDQVSRDPTGIWKRWQISGETSDDLDSRLRSTFRTGAVAFQAGSASILFSAFLALLSGAYAVWAVLLLFGDLTDGCIGLSVVFEAIVISLRVAFITSVLYVAFRLYDLLQRHKLLGSGSAAASPSQPGYGSTATAGQEAKEWV